MSTVSLWSIQEGNKLLEVKENETEIHCKTTDVQTIKACRPIPKEGKFHFEATILDSGENPQDLTIGVGVCEKSYPVNSFPGWYPISFGYHSDDGGIFCGSGKSTYQTNKPFKIGDIIGILLDYETASLTFSKNKEEVQKIQLTSQHMIKNLHPCIGFNCSKGTTVQLDFPYTGSSELLTICIATL